MLLDPIAFHVPFINWPVHWYGIFYAVGVAFTVWILPIILKARGLKIERDKVWDIVFMVFLCAIIGARLGYFLFYHVSELFSMQLFKIWEGGMSFHGGLIGGAIGAIWAAKRFKIPLLKLADAIVVPLSFGLALGRFGNFINDEIVGTVTTAATGVEFRGWEGLRHPVQLYAIGKNLIMFFIFIYIIKKQKSWPDGMIFALWVMAYGFLRFFVEFFREPDWTYLGLSGGQWLCLGMIFAAKFLAVGIIGIEKKKQYQAKKQAKLQQQKKEETAA